MKRSQPAKSLPTVFASLHGTARVYTPRHIRGCALTDRRDNRCSCPKWIYKNARGLKPVQQAAGTPSFAEACELAQRWLRGLDPEIRAARAVIQPPASGSTVEDALDRFFRGQASRKLSDSYLDASRAVFYRRDKKRKGNLSLLDFLDLHNRSSADPITITRIDQLSKPVLDDWTAHWTLNDMTAKLWRTVARGFFQWAYDEGLGPARLPKFGKGQRLKTGNRCGYFTDDEYARLMQGLSFYRRRFGPELPPSYGARLGAFIDLGRWAGMGMADIVRFSPSLNLSATNVITYRRKKTGQVATVLLDPTVAARLRDIASEPGSSPEQPFRFPGSSAVTNGKLWRERFQKLCAQVGIHEIETETGTRRRPHPHMLRDTFAIDAITRGVDLLHVSKMLGHATVDMTQRSYLFWIQKRLDHCIEDQRAALARVQVAPAVEARRDDGLRPLVH